MILEKGESIMEEFIKAFRINDSVSVFNDESYIRVYDSGKEILRRPTRDFRKAPSIVFESIKNCISSKS